MWLPEVKRNRKFTAPPLHATLTKYRKLFLHLHLLPLLPAAQALVSFACEGFQPAIGVVGRGN